MKGYYITAHGLIKGKPKGKPNVLNTGVSTHGNQDGNPTARPGTGIMWPGTETANLTVGKSAGELACDPNVNKLTNGGNARGGAEPPWRGSRNKRADMQGHGDANTAQLHDSGDPNM